MRTKCFSFRQSSRYGRPPAESLALPQPNLVMAQLCYLENAFSSALNCIDGSYEMRMVMIADESIGKRIIST